ncbi:hypothetical protein H4K58_002531 [Salmonella enterica]|nr:hypothetical protein [Salmonella enterica]EGA0122040.1 hypothetical protein [Salmonella enterica]EGQ2362766.1 hypothetical protein [Salmonella enterica]
MLIATTKPDIQNVGGQALTTSLAIASHFGKQHKNVIQKIQSLDCSPEFNGLNFQPVEYTDDKGERRPAYNITRDGFAFLAMGFTGSKAAKFKEAYINAFNEMERQLTNVAPRAEAAPGLDASLEDTRFVVDAQGRFLLLPIYYAAGSQMKHRPTFWMMQAATMDLFERVQDNHEHTLCEVVKRGLSRGTYVVRELVEHYARWVDPELVPAVRAALKRKPMSVIEWEKIVSRRLGQKIAAAMPRKPTPPVLPAPPIQPVEPMSLQNIQLAGQVIEFMFDSLNINNDKAKEVIRDLNKMIN